MTGKWGPGELCSMGRNRGFRAVRGESYLLARTDHDDEAQTEQIDTSDADAEPTAEQLAAMEAADAASAAETPEADDKSEE